MPSVTCDKYKTFGIVICTCCLFECSNSAFSPCSGRAQGSGPAGVSAIKLMDRRFTDLCFLPSFNTRSTPKWAITPFRLGLLSLSSGQGRSSGGPLSLWPSVSGLCLALDLQRKGFTDFTVCPLLC
jgi:hypothetical protein